MSRCRYYIAQANVLDRLCRYWRWNQREEIASERFGAGKHGAEDILKEPLRQQKERAGSGASRSPTHIRPRLELGARLSSSRPQSVAMKITGHKTESIYRRYAIVCDGD